ncbi:MAG: hypothetical protein Q9183_001587 [Haloplaca sp. 2 TL-2023]
MSSLDESRPKWLLLLPHASEPITADSIKSSYATVLAQVLLKAADLSSSFRAVTILDVVIPYPNVDDSTVFDYSGLQYLLGQLYRLVSLLCARYSIDVQYNNDVDVRISLIKQPSGENASKTQEVAFQLDPISDIQTLATCGRPWQRVCSVDHVDGEVLLQLFLKLRKPSINDTQGKLVIERFPAERSPSLEGNVTSSSNVEGDYRRHESVAVGGTFDHLHVGHKLLLSMTALVLNNSAQSHTLNQRALTIGITGDALLTNKKFSEYLQDWEHRQAAVQAFMLDFFGVEAPLKQTASKNQVDEEARPQRKVVNVLSEDLTINYVEIFDAFGPTITDENISALVLSGETRAGGKAVNDKRADKGWPALDIFEVDVLDTHDDNKETSEHETEDFTDKISSTEIRRRIATKPES